MLEISVIRPAEYKLPIIREICIGMFSLYVKMKLKKNYHIIIIIIIIDERSSEQTISVKGD